MSRTDGIGRKRALLDLFPTRQYAFGPAIQAPGAVVSAAFYRWNNSLLGETGDGCLVDRSNESLFLPDSVEKLLRMPLAHALEGVSPLAPDEIVIQG